jgi:hypothetical protein
MTKRGKLRDKKVITDVIRGCVFFNVSKSDKLKDPKKDTLIRLFCYFFKETLNKNVTEEVARSCMFGS